MTDRYASFVQSGAGRALVKRLGLPEPPRLRRYTPGDPLVPGPVLLGSATGGRLAEPVGKILAAAGVEPMLMRGGGVAREPSGPARFAAIGRVDRRVAARRAASPVDPVDRSVRPAGPAAHDPVERPL